MSDKMIRPFYLSKMRYGDEETLLISCKYETGFIAEVYDENDAHLIVDALNAFGEELQGDGSKR